MLRLAFYSLARSPLRSLLALSGLLVAMAVLICLIAFGQGYRQALAAEINRMGVQLMLVPLGCPYEGAAQVIKGKNLDTTIPASALELAQADPAVAIAAPLLIVAVPRPAERRTDMWVGLDERSLALKPWWHFQSGAWFQEPNSAILGAEAAALELRRPGDKFYSPEVGKSFKIAGVLQRSGTSDDNLFFVPLSTAQQVFAQPQRLTAIAIRLKDPSLLHSAVQRLQRIPGAQVVTLTEMMGTFLNLVGAVRTMILAIAVVALTASGLGIFNTLLAAVVDRVHELTLMRALGASGAQVFALITLESLLLTITGCAGGLGLAILLGRAFETAAKRMVPVAPAETLLSLSGGIVIESFAIALGLGLVAGVYPAWRASRIHPAMAIKAE